MIRNISFALVIIGLAFLFQLILAEYCCAEPQGGIQSCLKCHADAEWMKKIKTSLTIDRDKYIDSVHGAADIHCVECHIDLKDLEEFPHKEKLEKVQCKLCHDDIYARYSKSIHAISLLEEKKNQAASCVNCHGSHYILPKDNPESMVFHRNIPQTCSLCHSDEKIAPARDAEGSEIVKSFLESAHGWALTRSGLVVSAVCTNCHGVHDIKSINSPNSRVARKNIPTTCTKCHEGIYAKFIKGIHGQEFLKGNKDVPICTDCHGEHNIKPHYDPRSSIYSQHISKLCSKCHEDQRLIIKYNLPPARVESFMESFHGIASKFGALSVANCSSCHGHHEIRPSSDPKSSIHPDNIAKTCGHCHSVIEGSIIKGKIHGTLAKERHWVVRLVRNAYSILIVCMVIGFVTFIAADTYVKLKERKVKEP